MTVLTQILNGSAGADVRETLNAWSKGRDSAILIAPADAPAYVKDRADVVLTGTNDASVINSVINNLPVLPNFERSKVLVTGAKYGFLRFAPGRVLLSEPIAPPAASVLRIEGAGLPSWRPIDTVQNAFEGGTQFYSTAPTGEIFLTSQYTGNRTDDGLSNTIPVMGLDLSHIDFRVFNPATTQSGKAAITLDGVTTGEVSRINVHADKSVNALARIPQGIRWSAGARTDRKAMRSIAVTDFRDAGVVTSTTHLHMELIAAARITDGTSSCGFQIAHDQDCTYEQLHAFSTGIGIKATGGQPLDIKSIHFESLSEPVRLNDAAAQALVNHRIQRCELNGDVDWGTGYLSTNFIVDQVVKFNQPSLRTRNRIQITVAAGATSGSANHNLIAAPKSQNASARADIGSGNRAWLTTTATQATVTLAAAAPAGGVVFDVYVECA